MSCQYIIIFILGLDKYHIFGTMDISTYITEYHKDLSYCAKGGVS